MHRLIQFNQHNSSLSYVIPILNHPSLSFQLEWDWLLQVYYHSWWLGQRSTVHMVHKTFFPTSLYAKISNYTETLKVMLILEKWLHLASLAHFPLRHKFGSYFNASWDLPPFRAFKCSPEKFNFPISHFVPTGVERKPIGILTGRGRFENRQHRGFPPFSAGPSLSKCSH